MQDCGITAYMHTHVVCVYALILEVYMHVIISKCNLCGNVDILYRNMTDMICPDCMRRLKGVAMQKGGHDGVGGVVSSVVNNIGEGNDE